MFCWNCGSQVLEFAKFCPSCGSGRHGPPVRQAAAEAADVVQGAVDDAVRRTKRAVDSARPAVARSVERVENRARRVKERVRQK